MSESSANTKKKNSKIAGIIVIIVGTVILLSGVIDFVTSQAAKSEAEYIASKNTTVQAKVENVRTDKVKKKSSSGMSSHYVNQFHAQVTHNYNGKDYIQRDINLGSLKPRVGDEVTLHIDPDDPSHALYSVSTKKVNKNAISGVFKIVFGIICVITGIFVMKKKIGVDLKSFSTYEREERFLRSHPVPSVKDLDKHYEHYGEFSQSELSQYIDMAHRTNNMNTIYERTPTDEELLRAQQDSYNNKSAERRKRAEMERYQDSRGFGSNYIDNPKAKYEKGSDAWDDDLLPIYDEPPEYQASKFARPSPTAGKYDPNVAYRSPDMDSLDPISPFTSNDSDDDDCWGFLEK